MSAIWFLFGPQKFMLLKLCLFLCLFFHLLLFEAFISFSFISLFLSLSVCIPLPLWFLWSSPSLLCFVELASLMAMFSHYGQTSLSMFVISPPAAQELMKSVRCCGSWSIQYMLLLKVAEHVCLKVRGVVVVLRQILYMLLLKVAEHLCLSLLFNCHLSLVLFWFCFLYSLG